MNPPALQVEIRHAVHPGLTLDLALELGDDCGVVFGASGAGKSTLLRLIAGLARPDSGRVALGGRTLFDSAAGISLPLRDRRVGMIFQDDRLFPHLDTARNVAFGLNGWTRAEARRRVAEVAALCGVEHLLDRPVANLSGGERQRVGLARALAPRPRLLLSDEPVSALDLDGRNALIARLAEARRAERVPMLHVTHSPSEALALGDHLFLLRDGRIAARGRPAEVLAGATDEPPDPRSAPHADWADARNTFAATVARHAPDGGATVLALAGGPELVVSRLDLPPGHPVVVAVRADEILLAVGPVGLVSARNILPGRVDRVAAHGREAEVIVRAGGTAWVAGLVEPAVAALGLKPGCEVHMIIKARSCRVVDARSG